MFTAHLRKLSLATYSVQIWNAQIIEVRHNAAPSVGAAEIISSRLTNVREVRRLLAHMMKRTGTEVKKIKNSREPKSENHQ